MNKLLLSFLFICSAWGCRPHTKPLEKSSFQQMGDTLTLTVTKHRYFLVSYWLRIKGQYGGGDINGMDWFQTGRSFFNLAKFDSAIYRSLPMKRKCYSNIIITSFHEMTASDYSDFAAGSQGDPEPGHQQDCCEGPKFYLKDTAYIAK